MTAIRAATLAVRFLLELAALGALAWWGYTRAQGTAGRLALAIAAPVLVALLWGALIAPNARVPWSQQVRNALGLIVFLAAAAALAATGRATLAWAMAAVAVVDTALLVWKGW